MTGAGVEGAATKSKREAVVALGCSEAKAVVAAPTPAKNMMCRERVEYFLNKKITPYPRTGKIDPDADEFDELQKELAENRERIRKEVAEKGYVYVPDGYEENHRCNLEAYQSAYLEVYAWAPPA